MRNHPPIPSPCHLVGHGHHVDPGSGAGYPARGENWVAARVKVVMEYAVGMVVYVYVAGSGQRFFAHDLFMISRLLDPARSMGPEDFGALFNEQFQLIALPDLRSGARPEVHLTDLKMVRLSVSRAPLGPCETPFDEALDKEFAALTAGGVASGRSGLPSRRRALPCARRSSAANAGFRPRRMRG